MPRVMAVPSSPADGVGYLVRVYAFYISKEDAFAKSWAPANYADADAGIIRHATTGEVRSQSLVEGQGEDDFVHLTITSSPLVLVAVDPVNHFYAYRIIEYQIPMPKLYIPVRFQLWKTEPYTDSEWRIAGE